jgi:hypothetical protein
MSTFGAEPWCPHCSNVASHHLSYCCRLITVGDRVRHDSGWEGECVGIGATEEVAGNRVLSIVQDNAENGAVTLFLECVFTRIT